MINENEGDMELSTCFPIWDKLTPGQQTKLSAGTNFRKAKKGTIIHSGSMECTGLLAVQSASLGLISFLRRDGKLPYTGCLTWISACFLRPV